MKEYYSPDDYAVKIQAAVVARGDDYYPYEKVRFLRELLSARASVAAVSDYLLLFDIYEVAVENVEWIQEAGTQDMQLLEISGYSDSTEELLDYVGDE